MAVNYCSLLTKNEALILAESNTSISYGLRVDSFWKDMKKGKATDKIELDKEHMIYYLRTDNLIFVEVCKKGTSEEKSVDFLEYFVDIVLGEFKSFEAVTKVDGRITKYQHQQLLNPKLNSLVKAFEGDIYKDKNKIASIQYNIDETKKLLKTQIKKAVETGNNLQELDKKAEKINIASEIYEENARELKSQTRCIKPWMIAVAAIFLLIVIYIIVAVSRCGSAYKVWC